MESVLGSVRERFRYLVTRLATDVTEPTTTRTALILAPHPDDETLGCGATISRKRSANTEVHLAIATDGRHSHQSEALTPQALAELRRAELEQAAERLGVPQSAIHWLGFEDGTLIEHQPLLTRRILDLLIELEPQECYVTSAEEPHSDHATIGLAARRAVAELPGTELFEYPIWLWDAWPVQQGRRWASFGSAIRQLLRGRTVRVATDGYSEQKMYALGAHVSQLGRPAEVPDHHLWDGLPATARARAAEPYEIFFRVS